MEWIDMKLKIEVEDELMDKLFAKALKDAVDCASEIFNDLYRKLDLKEHEEEDFIMLRDYLAAAKIVAKYHGVKL
jgi:hypothetical protein